MKRLLAGWFFYTVLLLFLMAAALTIPELTHDFMGNTRQELTETVDQLTQKAVTVWGQSFP